MPKQLVDCFPSGNSISCLSLHDHRYTFLVWLHSLKRNPLKSQAISKIPDITLLATTDFISYW